MVITVHSPQQLTYTGSKPTVWDGDHPPEVQGHTEDLSSKPTAWDGDYSLTYRSRITASAFTPSPPRGMATTLLLFQTPQQAGSEPTVWDGDAETWKAAPWQHLRSKPTVWDGDG